MVEVQGNIREAFDDFSINNWAIAGFYLPTHYTANSLALYEYCNFSQILNTALPFTPEDVNDLYSYDFGGMLNTFTRTIYAAAVDTK